MTLIRHYKANEASGTTAIDTGSQLTNATYTGGTIAVNVAGKINTCYSVNANSDWLNVPSSTANIAASSSWSMAFWLYPTAVTAGYWMSNDSVSSGTFLYAYIYGTPGGADWRFTCLNAAGGGQVNVAIPSLAINTWSHITITYNSSGVMKTYFNGAYNATGTFLQTTLGKSPDPLSFGSGAGAGSGGANKGRFDDIRIYNTVLTDAEVTALYNSGNGTESESFGWAKKILGITPAKVNNIAVANISKVNGA